MISATILTIRKMGNTAGLALPVKLLRDLKLAVGSTLTVSQTPEGLLLKPAQPCYSLAQLLAQCDPLAPAPKDLAEWDAIKPVGKEW